MLYEDVVALYAPPSPYAVAAMLACTRIGAVHTVIFAGFSSEAIATRLQDSEAVAVVVADSAVRGGKRIDLRSTMNVALRDCPGVRTVFVDHSEDGEKPDLKANEFLFHEVKIWNLISSMKLSALSCL